MTGEANYSLADIGALMNNRNDGWGGNNSFIWIVVLFLFFGFGRNGFGNGSGLTQAELQQGFDTQSLLRGQEGIKNGICDGFYAQNTTMLQGFNGLQRDLCTGFGSVNSAITENRFAAQQCCCETNRNIDAVRYENSRNTCDIVRAIEKDGEATRALINSNTMQALRDKVVEQNQAIQSRDFQLSQLSQNAYLVNKLQPTPQPAYLTCSPYESSNYAYDRLYDGYGRRGGCGCGGW